MFEFERCNPAGHLEVVAVVLNAAAVVLDDVTLVLNDAALVPETKLPLFFCCYSRSSSSLEGPCLDGTRGIEREKENR